MLRLAFGIFHVNFAIQFDTVPLAHMLDSLVRVSRRVGASPIREIAIAPSNGTRIHIVAHIVDVCRQATLPVPFHLATVLAGYGSSASTHSLGVPPECLRERPFGLRLIRMKHRFLPIDFNINPLFRVLVFPSQY